MGRSDGRRPEAGSRFDVGRVPRPAANLPRRRIAGPLVAIRAALTLTRRDGGLIRPNAPASPLARLVLPRRLPSEWPAALPERRGNGRGPARNQAKRCYGGPARLSIARASE